MEKEKLKRAAVAFKQLEFSDLKRHEFRQLVRQLNKLPNFDSAAEKIIFLKFDTFVPACKEEIAYCRKKNEEVAELTMGVLAKVINTYTNYKL